MGLELAATQSSVAVSLAVYQFVNLPVFVAILAGFSVLHDRTCGAMPFLMLAPLTRRQLLLGKVAGALALPTLMHLVFVGLGAAVLVVSGVETEHPELFGAVPGWWVAYLLTCPAGGAVLGAIGTVISALARDERTAYQWVSFTIGLLSVGMAIGLVKTIPEGVFVQLLLTAACLVVAFLILLVGAALISRDIEPAP
jgi:ABC-type transport system involved in multi-copper enzyme maturation permease subunit